MADIFISYAREDTERALAVREVLARRYTVSMDCDIPPGARYRDWIEEHLRDSSACVVLWSRDAIRKSWVLDEAGEVHRLSKPLIPLIIDEELDGDRVPMGFRQLQYLRCKWRADELEPKVEEALLATLDSHLKSAEPLRAGIEQLRAELVKELGVDYEILEELGTGRLSVVYKARSKSGGLCAISVTPVAGVLLFPGFLAHFLAGVRVAQSLKHKYILEIRQLAFRGSIACQVMEFVEGHALSTLVARGPLELRRVRHIAERIAEGLAFAHSRDVVHANLRSACILLDQHDRPVITDFVMAQMRGGENIATTSTALLADPRYLSPEQCRGEPVGYYADQYALGVIVFELLTGVLPFDGSSPYMIMQAQCTGSAPPIASLRPSCPRAVQDTVSRLLAKDPWSRYLSGEELVDDIRAWPTDDASDLPAPPSQSPARTVAEARASYARCVGANPCFLRAFYQNLIKNEAIRRHFYGVPVDRLSEKLGDAIEILFSMGVPASGEDKDAKPARPAPTQAEVERIAGQHRRLELGDKEFATFVEVLINLALDTDPSAKQPSERPLLQAAWQAALAPGMAEFRKQCDRRVPRSVSQPPPPNGASEKSHGKDQRGTP